MNAIHNNNLISDAPLIWVVDDDHALRMILEDTLTDSGFHVQTFGNAQAAWQILQDNQNKHTQVNETPTKQVKTDLLPNVIMTDIRMPIMNGLDFSSKIHEQFAHIPVIIMTAHADVQSAVDSYQSGAFDYLPKPFELDDAVAMVTKACQQNQPQLIKDTYHHFSEPSKQSQLNKNTDTDLLNSTTAFDEAVTSNPSGIIGQSVAMQKVFRAIGRLSHMPMTVLITGESGTGKELIASALHEHSPRKTKPFIALNMAAIPHDLIEAELFGHEKGAFTGATTTRQGRFEQAHGGTLFLDEIGDMPLPTQTRLLRVLANGEFYRVGGLKPIKVDVRIIAATHQNLENLVKEGKFREDLFYRLNVIRLALPSLRERPEDIPLLIDFFMKNIAKSMQTLPKSITPAAMQILQRYRWQGNVRQLENTCRWLTVMTTGQTIQPTDLPPEILQAYQAYNAASGLVSQPAASSPSDPSANLLQEPMQNSLTDLSNNTLHTEQIAKDFTQSHVDTPSVDLAPTVDWITPLQHWAKQALAQDQHDILQIAYPMFEKCLLEVALTYTSQHKGQAADLLGWGRNTVTRKYQQLIESKPVKNG